MWSYEKRLQFPVNIKEPNAKIAQVIMSQYGGPDGELGASMRYISQRYSMPYNEVAAILTDIGTEELAHLETAANSSPRGTPSRICLRIWQQTGRCRKNNIAPSHLHPDSFAFKELIDIALNLLGLQILQQIPRRL